MRPPRRGAAHQAALQAIADANGGTRAEGTPGYEASVDYVLDVLEATGWDGRRACPFQYRDSEAVLEQMTPLRAAYPTGGTGTGEGDVTGNVFPSTSTSTADAPTRAAARRRTSLGSSSPARRHRPDPARHLHVRGKALNAEAAGAEAVIIFNQGERT